MNSRQSINETCCACVYTGPNGTTHMQRRARTANHHDTFDDSNLKTHDTVFGFALHFSPSLSYSRTPSLALHRIAMPPRHRHRRVTAIDTMLLVLVVLLTLCDAVVAGTQLNCLRHPPPQWRRHRNRAARTQFIAFSRKHCALRSLAAALRCSTATRSELDPLRSHSVMLLSQVKRLLRPRASCTKHVTMNYTHSPLIINTQHTAAPAFVKRQLLYCCLFCSGMTQCANS